MQAAIAYFFASFNRFEHPLLFHHLARRDLAADDRRADAARDRAKFMLEMLAHEPGDYEIHSMRQFFPGRF